MTTDTNDLSDGATINLEAACAAVCLRCKQGGNRPLRIDGIWVHPFPAVVGCEVCGANALRNLPSTESAHDARLRRALKRCGHRLNRAHATLQQLGERLRKCRSGVGAPTEWWHERWQEWSDWARVELEQAGITEPQQVRWGSHTQCERLSALLRELKGGGLNSEVESLRGALPIVRAAIAVRRHAGNIWTGAFRQALNAQRAALIAAPSELLEQIAGGETGYGSGAGSGDSRPGPPERANPNEEHVSAGDEPATAAAIPSAVGIALEVLDDVARNGWVMMRKAARDAAGELRAWIATEPDYAVPPEPPAPRCETCLHCDLNHDCAPWCTLYGVGVAPRYGWSCRGYERRSGKLVRDPDGKETMSVRKETAADRQYRLHTAAQAEPEPRGCPTPGACAAVAAGWSLASEPIATEAQNDRWEALTVRLERLAAEIVPLRDEAEVRAEALKPVREALLTAGHCGDGDVAAMVVRAIALAKHHSEQLLADAIQDTCAVVDAVAPESSGTLAERTTAALAKVRADERERCARFVRDNFVNESTAWADAITRGQRRAGG